MDLPPDATLAGVFVATADGALPDGTASGIFKQAVSGPVEVAPLGLAGDRQVDRSVHGGPDKAVHHFPAEHYAPLADAFAGARGLLAPGSIGENLSTLGLTEANVAIGDVFAAGSVRLELTQPRRPCWKIDGRYDVRGMAAWIQQAGATGWYYRVLEPGLLAAGEPLTLVDRAPDAVSVAEFNHVTRT
ncbi:MAG: MOSC domain-containing protein, partial [Gammaproteobacteria bacterium]